MAVVVALDRLLDRLVGFSGRSWIEAERDYRRLARGRWRGRRPLRYLADDEGWAAAAPRRRLGVQAIEVGSVVGSSDREKARAFDAEFRPPAWSRERWILMCLAVRGGVELPPIAVYRVGGEHYVRDGHHRVSVARALGREQIDADVVELLRPDG